MEDARRKLEAKMDRERKEKRDSKLEMARRPLLCTPNSKRRREDTKDWEAISGGGSPARRMLTPGRRMSLQTPINSFLVTKTIEERRMELKKVPKEKVQDMSASASLRRKANAKTRGSRKPQLVSRMT